MMKNQNRNKVCENGYSIKTMNRKNTIKLKKWANEIRYHLFNILLKIRDRI